MRARCGLWGILGLAMALQGCRHGEDEYVLEGKTMGTAWRVTLDRDAKGEPQEIRSLLQSRLDDLEAMFTNWREDSVVEKFNASTDTGWQPVPRELAEVLSIAREISQKTDGAFDVTLAPLIKLWGFAGGSALETVPSDEVIQRLKSECGWQKLEVRLEPPALRKANGGLQLNVSALVEGYAVDDLAALLRSKGIHNFMLDVGGEIYASGHRPGGAPWTVGVQVPGNDKDQVVTTIPLEDKALATSGVYRQFVELDGVRYPHVLDSRTGWPLKHGIQSVSVVSDRCVMADVWATALLILGEEGRPLAEKEVISAIFLQSEPRKP